MVISEDLSILYNEKGWSLNQIGKKFSIKANSVKYRLLKLGVKLRPKGRYKTYKFNEDFFAIPNELNSYWAGFIAADFSLRRQGGKRRLSELSCSLAVKDKDQLERFMSDIGHSSAVKVRQRIRKGKRLFVAEISITSSKMLDDLFSNFNVCTGKTIRLNPPIDLVREHKLAFIAGYIDGDGWVQYKRYLNLGVCGTYKVVTWIKNILDKELLEANIEGRTGKVVKRKNLSVWRANIHSWYLAELLEKIPVAKMSRKLPKIYQYKELHTGKFKKKQFTEKQHAASN
jgi:hypothetical protein